MKRMVSVAGRMGKILAWLLLGAVLGAILLATQGPEGPPLEAWHTEELAAEFTADRVGEIRNFEDYLRLEDRLFAEMDEEIYRRGEAGTAPGLVRYHAGSAADPRGRSPDWNRSFELAADALPDSPRGGVLLLHGMSDSPYSLRALGETLAGHGYRVLGLRLPGHGTIPSGLTSVVWEDMAAAVRLSMDHLASELGAKPIHIVGYSTGAPLALDFALDALEGKAAPEPASLILISPAIRISPAAALAKWMVRLARLPGLERLAWTNVLPEFDPYKYNSFATNAGDQVDRVTRVVAGRIAARSNLDGGEGLPPILALKSTVDATVSTNAVIDNLLARLAPDRHELVLFDINRVAVKSSLMIADPGPLTARVMADEGLPFAVTLVANENPDSRRVLVRHKPPFSGRASTSEPLGFSWPAGVISLSHVALPFPPDDPLYGRRPTGKTDRIFLGQIAIQGERGLLQFPSDWLLRLRHNPFYGYLEARVIDWMDRAGRAAPSNDANGGGS